MRVAGCLVVVAVALPPLLVNLGRRDAARVMENVAMATSQETWFRLHGVFGEKKDPAAWLLPSFNGRPRIVKPPLVTWLHLLAFSGLDPQTASCETLVLRARLTSVAAALLTVLGLYLFVSRYTSWSCAVVAGGIPASLFFFQRYARTAAYDIHLTAWITLAFLHILSGTLQPDPSRRGHLLLPLGAGVCLALAWLAKGPVAFLLFLVPAGVLAASQGKAGMPLVRTALTAASIALLCVIPWYVYIFLRLPDAWNLLFYDYVTFNIEQGQPWYYYAGVFGLIFPWTMWSMAALVSRPPGRHPPQSPMMRPSWLWFWTLVVAMSFFSSKQQRYILPVVAPLAITIASAAMEWQGNPDRLPGWRRWLLTFNPWLVLSAGFLICLIATLTLQLEAAGILQPGDFSRVGAPLAFGMFLLAAGAAVVIHRLQRRDRYVAAAIAMVMAASLLCTFGWHAYTHTDSARQVADNKRINRIIGHHPLYYLKLTPRDEWLIGHCEGFLFYVRRSCPPVAPGDLFGVHAPLYVMSFVESDAEAILQRAGYRIVTNFFPQREYPAILWRRADSTDDYSTGPALPR